MARERPVSAKARAYLRAFEAWLPVQTGKAAARVTTARKAEAFDDLVDGIVPTVEEELATAERCPGCGGPMLRDVVSGAQRAYCCNDCRDEAENRR